MKAETRMILSCPRQRRQEPKLKPALAVLLAALALQPAASAAILVSSYPDTGPMPYNMWVDDYFATSFTTGPVSGLNEKWQVEKISAPWAGSILPHLPTKVSVTLLSDSQTQPGSPGDLFVSLGEHAPLSEIKEYDYIPSAELFLEPETTYWLSYEILDKAGVPSGYTAGVSHSPTETEALPGWSIGDNAWERDLQTGDWTRQPNGGSAENALGPFVFSVSGEAVVPEPSEYALFFALGLGAFALWHRRRQQEQRTVA
ncbi:MAG: hypothetical protein M2R45_02845 [Verrucomicrobia subdivision 3 bacterium]|nr:hypothetical protein [Limisphaerales bacterium]MCS1415452.1 hypothetical protein [Limisphaerales bacterium]